MHEYDDVVFDKCTAKETMGLHKIQYETARIATSWCYKVSTISNIMKGRRLI